MVKRLIIISLIITVLAVLALIIYLISGHDNTLTLREYKLKSDKLSSSLKIAFVSDLHGTQFGENNIELVEMIKAAKPDIILLGGDMFDHPSRIDVSKSFISQITKLYPVYGVMGNHEYRVEGYTSYELKQLYRELGVTLLENETAVFEHGEEKINICGADVFGGDADWQDKTVEHADIANYTVVINHRPDQWTEFAGKGVDLMLSGHAHGGQWIVPGMFNGILAPNQGLFPKYAGGLYKFEDGMTLAVSRGLALANTRIPRAFNPPELVVITVK